MEARCAKEQELQLNQANYILENFLQAQVYLPNF
jgi:hypothetical protein